VQAILPPRGPELAGSPIGTFYDWGVGGEPVVFPLRRYEMVIQRVQLSFSTFTRLRQESLLRDDLRSDVIPVPFARADGLAESIDGSVDRMQSKLAAGVPGTVRAAEREVIATIHADLGARVRAEYVVLLTLSSWTGFSYNSA